MISRIDVGPMLKADILAEKPQIVRVKKFNEEGAEAFCEALGRAVSLGQPFVPVVVDSYGGEVYSLLAMIEAVRGCPVPVATILEGKAMSCGAMLFAMGSPGLRFMSPHGHLMMHHVSTSTWGIVPAVKEDVMQAEHLDRQIFEMVDERCGHPKGFFRGKLKGLEGADWYIKPDEALALNVADRLGVPVLATRVRATMDLEFAAPRE